MDVTDQDLRFVLCRPCEADARQVLDWRNDPETRQASFHRDEKRWEDFWPQYRDQMLTAAVPPVFVQVGGQAVGFLRFRPLAHPRGLSGQCVDLSVMLAPQTRGQGMGRRVLAAALGYLRRWGVDTVVAEVRQDNAASLKAFVAAGYGEPEARLHPVDDTGEVVAVQVFTVELSPPFWRRSRVYVIAEAGSNWRMGTPARDRAMARALIDAAVAAGADCVKFQTYRPETVYVANAGQSDYLSDAGVKDDISAIFADLAMPYDMIADLAAYCRGQGIDFMSTGFSRADFQAIDPHVAVHKIASYELSHVRLLDLAAASGKPLVLSTGAAGEDDIAWAVGHYQGRGGRDLCLMQCTAKYPAPLSSLNLRAIPALRQRFGVAVGLSDHSRDPLTGPLGAVALGARCIEKHYTLHNALPGPDHGFAITGDELALMVAKIREMEESLGQGTKTVQAEEQELKRFARRGVQVIAPVAVGDTLREDVNIAILRPGKQSQGVHPRLIDAISGHRATRALTPGEGVQEGDWE